MGSELFETSGGYCEKRNLPKRLAEERYMLSLFDCYITFDYVSSPSPFYYSLYLGVGLCHGISGNAYCFLALYRGMKDYEERLRDVCSLDERGSIPNDSDEWLCWAHHFVKFAMDHSDELYCVPDHPYSMYEGISGLIILLHDLKDPINAHLPCYESDLGRRNSHTKYL